MNKVRVTVLVLYTLLLMLITGLVIYATDTSAKRFKGYTENPSDEYLQINLQMVEARESSKITEKDYEKTFYNMYVFLSKVNATDVINNIRLYLGIETVSGEYRYTEYSSTPKKLESASIPTSSTSFLNSSSAFCVKTISVDETTKEVTKVDQTPAKIFVKILYNVSTITEEQSLNYVCNVSKAKDLAKDSKFDELKYESNAVINPEALFTYQLSRGETELSSTSGKKINGEYIQVAKLFYNKDNLDKQDVSIDKKAIDSTEKVKNFKFEVYGFTSKADSSNTDGYYSNYIRLVSYYGWLPCYESRLISSRRVSFDASYGIDTLYTVTEIELANGRTISQKYFVKIK